MTRIKKAIEKAKVAAAKAIITFFVWQKPVFLDRVTGVLILFCSRQIGKSYVLAAWAFDRLLTQLKTNDTWLITLLSNSRDNGGEIALKIHEVAAKFGHALEIESNKDELDARSDIAEDAKFELMRFEIRVTLNGHVGRIKILAANPRTARGFSGDLILDEFAFHEDSAAIRSAAPAFSSSPIRFWSRASSRQAVPATSSSKPIPEGESSNEISNLKSQAECGTGRTRRRDVVFAATLALCSLCLCG